MCVYVGVKAVRNEVSEMRKHKSDEVGDCGDSARRKTEVSLP